jgi:hypothetical protein
MRLAEDEPGALNRPLVARFLPSEAKRPDLSRDAHNAKDDDNHNDNNIAEVIGAASVIDNSSIVDFSMFLVRLVFFCLWTASVQSLPYMILTSTRSKCLSVIAPQGQTITIAYHVPGE